MGPRVLIIFRRTQLCYVIIHIQGYYTIQDAWEFFDFSLKIWRVSDGELLQSINHTDKITCISYSADSQYLVTGSADKSLKVWEASTGKLTQVRKLTTASIWDLMLPLFRGFLILLKLKALIIYPQSALIIIRLSMQVLVEHDDIVKCAAITDGNRFVLSGSADKRLLVWGLSTGAVERQLIGHTGVVTCVKVTHDGSTAISGETQYAYLLTTPLMGRKSWSSPLTPYHGDWCCVQNNGLTDSQAVILRAIQVHAYSKPFDPLLGAGVKLCSTMDLSNVVTLWTGVILSLQPCSYHLCF